MSTVFLANFSKLLENMLKLYYNLGYKNIYFSHEYPYT